MRAGVRAVQQAHTVVILGAGKATLLRQLSGEQSTQVSPLCASYLDLGDDAEGTLAYAFPPVVRPPGEQAQASLARVADAVFLVTLDWSEPWTFANQLATWLPAIARVVRGAYTDSEAESDVLRVDMQNKMLDNFRAASSDPSLPLSHGALDENIGVPIAILLTKADLIDDRRVLSEKQVDYVQQVVRTIALRYGAAVFSVSRDTPLQAVREYIKNVLFSRQGQIHASAVDAATLTIPSGWDSWSNIRVADESFDCAAIIAAWSASQEAFEREFASAVPDPRVSPGAESGDRLVMADMQEFLAQLGEQGGVTEQDTGSGDRTSVGPSVDATSLDMPAVSKALAEQQRDAPERSAAGNTSPTRPKPAFGTPQREALASATSPSLTTPKQNEVLHSFFQSLLKKPGSPSTPSTPGTPGTPGARRPSSSRRAQ
ncbi:hypothetical protein MCUN1_003120 [Malassezia cuniculi]|uniref:Dynein light intermediate chain n=1 Tax=Malassezia cuniculi TaxID=948313 RepID=A0AAF0EWX8_9BASI|nr:hypothetical protein MCUN1_003120 [Malassezia cuniculi]